MPDRCYVPLCCKSSYRVCLPSDAVRLKEWLVKIRRDVSPAFQITERTKICSSHLKITDFRVTLNGR
ncbi:unnamed protein product [Porites evermanni]|uniref:THAP-type domain-containing protein n=1 Tax=Porites evermanni TaxID=104178 RepID=A0ABN8LVA4_9CNID|nr:unnamed protein product [Porites evermanni]